MNQKIALKDIPVIAQKLVALLPEKKVFTFSGPLGAGKTTLVQAMFKQLGVTGPVQSPTYTYMSVYTLKDGTKLYHFDLYRLNNENDFIAAGFDEYLYQPNSWCFIEWPEVIKDLLKKSVCSVVLDYAENEARIIKIL